MVAGIRRSVSERDLILRWFTWQRQLGEFENQGSMYLARETLRTLVETTAPDLGLPSTYQSLGSLATSAVGSSK